MEEDYRVKWTDAPSCFSSVTSEVKTKRIHHNAEAGPIELWAMQEVMDSMQHWIDWKTAP